jgi:hypothetical protein
MAPELIEARARFTDKADVYSLGVVLWEICTRLAAVGVSQSAVMSGTQRPFSADCPQALQKLVCRNLLISFLVSLR